MTIFSKFNLHDWLLNEYFRELWNNCMVNYLLMSSWYCGRPLINNTCSYVPASAAVSQDIFSVDDLRVSAYGCCIVLTFPSRPKLRVLSATGWSKRSPELSLNLDLPSPRRSRLRQCKSSDAVSLQPSLHALSMPLLLHRDCRCRPSFRRIPKK